MTKLIFKQDNRKNWQNIKTNLLQIIDEAKKDFEVEVKELKRNRSGQALRAYWVLIKAVTDWMNSQGNCFTKENVSDYFKIQSGHARIVRMYSVPKSISDRADCRREDMERLINTVLIFGAENGIENCYIEDRDLKGILDYYDKSA